MPLARACGKINTRDWRGGEAVTQGSAKPRCTGSIPVRASMKEYQPTTFLGALFGGLRAGREVIRPVVEKTEGRNGFLHEVYRYNVDKVKKFFAEKKANVIYRRRVRVA